MAGEHLRTRIDFGNEVTPLRRNRQPPLSYQSRTRPYSVQKARACSRAGRFTAKRLFKELSMGRWADLARECEAFGAMYAGCGDHESPSGNT